MKKIVAIGGGSILKYRVISLNERAAAYRVFKQRGAVVSEPIKQQTALRPLAELFRIE